MSRIVIHIESVAVPAVTEADESGQALRAGIEAALAPTLDARDVPIVVREVATAVTTALAERR